MVTDSYWKFYTPRWTPSVPTKLELTTAGDGRYSTAPSQGCKAGHWHRRTVCRCYFFRNRRQIWRSSRALWQLLALGDHYRPSYMTVQLHAQIQNSWTYFFVVLKFFASRLTSKDISYSIVLSIDLGPQRDWMASLRCVVLCVRICTDLPLRGGLVQVCSGI